MEHMAMKRCFLTILFVLAATACFGAAFSTPAAVSSSYSSDNDHYTRGGSRIVAISGTVICTVGDGAGWWQIDDYEA